MTYTLYRIEDDATTTFISEHGDLLDGIRAGERVVKHEDYDFSYGLYTDGLKVASFAAGRIGYREWAMRTGRLSPSVEDAYLRDEDEWVS